MLTAEFTAVGVTRLLEAIRRVDPTIRFYQASSSEMFGKVREVPQTETTPFYPRSPYGVAKVYGHFITVNYRESYNLFAVSGILFNHESPRRGLEFVTRKITDGVARIKVGLTDELLLGNLEAKRDWGFAGDYVRAMWLMLQADEPVDYVIATGREYAVQRVRRPRVRATPASTRPTTSRPTRVSCVRPRSTTWSATRRRRRAELGWEPEVSFRELVEMMVDADLERLSRAAAAAASGLTEAANSRLSIAGATDLRRAVARLPLPLSAVQPPGRPVCVRAETRGARASPSEGPSSGSAPIGIRGRRSTSSIASWSGTCPRDRGYFVEAGANDGHLQSNTYYFERFKGWTGVLIEPIPELYNRCVRERPRSRVLNYALVPDGYPQRR